MCGILGSVNLPIDKRTLDLIRHRGPDGEGLIDINCEKHRVTLAHRRLAIVDLSENGAQPMATMDGARHITFNGEIYNHQDIRHGLADRSFRGHSDTETLLEALAAFGTKVLPKLNGIFAFAYLDLQSHKLLLVRDPYGVKPLYYSTRPNSFCFASEMAPLRTMVAADLDKPGLSTLLKLRFVPSPRTLDSGIRRLRPGHVLEVGLGEETLVTREYPFFPRPQSIRRPPSTFSAALGDYAHHFEQAVSRQLMADVEVGVLLSGGIDSALVAASAQRASDHPLKAFTVGFKDADAGGVDEIDAAAATAEILGLEHYTTRIGFDDFLDVLRECVRIVEEPLATTSIIPMHFLSKLAAKHVKVVMSGQGADEILGGYRRYQVELWRRWVPPIMARAGSIIATKLGTKCDAIIRGLRALRETNDVSRFLAAYEVFTDEEILALTGSAVEPASDDIQHAYDIYRCNERSTTVERMMTIDARFGLSDDLLLYTDKITMRQSLECRVPLLDLEFVEFVESLPYNLRVNLGKSKIIHKAFAEKTLPASIVNRPKRGFQSPTQQWFKNEEVLRSILLDKSSPFSEHFELSAIEKVIQEHQQGFNRERQIFLLLCLSLYFRSLANVNISL